MSAPAADQFLEELAAARPAAAGQAVQKLRYSHEAMIDLIVANPWISQNQLAAHFGYSPSWISRVFASDAFQIALARRREEVVNPELKATLEERFKALVHQSLTRLMEKLDQPAVEANVALRAAELGAKALGLGGHAPAAPPAPSPDRLEKLAERLVTLQDQVRGRVINGEVSRVEVERE